MFDCIYPLPFLDKESQTWSRMGGVKQHPPSSPCFPPVWINTGGDIYCIDLWTSVPYNSRRRTFSLDADSMRSERGMRPKVTCLFRTSLYVHALAFAGVGFFGFPGFLGFWFSVFWSRVVPTLPERVF